MSEVNSLSEAAIDGLIAEQNSPVDSASTEPSFEAIVDANNKANDDLLARLEAAYNGVEAPAEQPAEDSDVSSESEVSEESSDEVETPVDESTDGTDSSAEEDDDSDEFVEDYSDDEVFDADSVQEGKFEVQWGDETKIMTWDQIQKQLSRSRSASEKSREAKEQLDAIEARSAELSDRESRLEKFDISNQHDRELVALDLQYRNVSQQIADAEGSVPKALLTQQQEIVDRFHAVQAEKNEVIESLRVDIPAAMSDFVSSLSKDAQVAVAQSPDLLKLAEKAKKFDELQKKTAASRPKLMAKKSMSKGKGGTPKTSNTPKKDAMSARVNKGIYQEGDSDVFLQSYLSSKQS